MTNHPDPITEASKHAWRIVGGPVVDDDRFKVDVALPQDAPQGRLEQFAPIARWDNDRNFGHARPVVSIARV